MRVNDILAELERQVGPLERQAEKARIYLKKKEELKTFDVNMFLLEMERIDRQLQEVKENYSIADRDYQEAKESYEQIKTEYEKLEQDMAAEDEKINAIRDEMSQSAVTKNKLESQIEILNEQIRSAEHTDEHMQSRLDVIDHEKEERISSGKTYEEEKVTLDAQISEIEEKKKAAGRSTSDIADRDREMYGRHGKRQK